MTLEIVTHITEKPQACLEYAGWVSCCLGCVVRCVAKLDPSTLIQFGPTSCPWEFPSAPELILAVKMRGYQVRIVSDRAIPDRAWPFLRAGSITDIHVGAVYKRAFEEPNTLVLFPNGDVYQRDEFGLLPIGKRLGNAYGQEWKELLKVNA